MSAIFQEFFPVTNEEKVKIRKLFEKNESDVIEDLEIIRNWLEKQPQIPKIQNDQLLEGILLRNKFRIEKTKLKIDKYFTAKCVYPEIFNSIDPCADHFLEVVNHSMIVPMPKLSPNLERVVYWKTGNGVNDDGFVHRDCLLLTIMYAETEMNYDYAASQVVILDMAHFSGTIIRKMDLVTLAKMTTIQLEAFSGRISAIHFVNISSTIDLIITLIKPFMPVKLFSKIQTHPKLETLYKHLPKECLPSEIGGTGPSAVKLFDHLITKFKNEHSTILKRNCNGTNEKLRIGEPPLKSNMFGVDGTFKKINLD